MVRFNVGKCAGDGKYLGTTAHAHTSEKNAMFGTICLAPKVFRYWKHHPVYGWNHVRRLLLHEMAHLQLPREHHGKRWQDLAIRLGASYYWLGGAMTKRNPK